MQSKTILECKNDGLFLIQSTSKNTIYGKEYFLNQPNSFNQSYFLSKLRTIQKLTAKNQPSILDIGCGWGDFEEVLEREKIPYLGIDLNKEAIEICKKKGLNCKQIQSVDDRSLRIDNEDRNLKMDKNQSSSLHTQPSSLFDAITMFQVIEHLKNPIPTLQTAKKLLKPNGLLLITTPNNDSPIRKLLGPKWSIYNEPSHFVFYNKITLQKVLEKATLKNIQTNIDHMRFLSSNYILQRLIDIYLHWKLDTGNWKLSFPLPTDPFGDIETIAIKS